MGAKYARADQKILLEARKWRFFEAGVAYPCQILQPACNFAIMFGCIRCMILVKQLKNNDILGLVHSIIYRNEYKKIINISIK